MITSSQPYGSYRIFCLKALPTIRSGSEVYKYITLQTLSISKQLSKNHKLVMSYLKLPIFLQLQLNWSIVAKTLLNTEENCITKLL